MRACWIVLKHSQPGLRSAAPSLPAPVRDSSQTRRQLEELATRLENERDRARASETHLRAIIDTTPECVKLVGSDGTLLHMNPSGLSMIEADSCDLVAGRSIYGVIAPEDRDRFRAFNERICAGEKGTLHFDIIGLRGNRRHMETHAAPLRLADGRLAQLALTRDITQRRRAEEQLRQSEARFRTLITATSDIVYRMSADWSEMLRLDGKRFIADTNEPRRDWMEQYIPASDRDAVRHAIAVAIENKCVFALDHRVIRADGTLGWTSSRAVPQLDENGDITEWLGTASDITESVHAENELRRLRERAEHERRMYRTVLSATPDFAYVIDRNHRFTYANEALLKMWGRTWENTIGKTFLELDYPAWHAAMHDSEIEQVVATRAPIRGEIPFTGTHGRRIYDYIFVPVFGANGEVEAIAGTTRDITDRKRKEDQLRFIVQLNALTQPLTDADDLMRTTARALGDHLDVDRCAYAEIEDEATFVITGDYPRHLPSIVGRWPVASFGAACTRCMLNGESFVVTDCETDPRLTPDDLAAYRATQIRAVICVPLHKAGKFTAAMAVHQGTPRQWTPDDIDLVELVGARCWESLERARALRLTNASEQRLRFMAEAMPQKIFSAKATGEIDYVNPQWLEFTGAEMAGLLRWNWLRFVHQDDRDENLRRWRHALDTGTGFEIEHRFRRHDDTYRWHLIRAHPMRDPAGRVQMWIGSSTDIEEQKRAEETLEQVVIERTAQLRETIGELEAFSYSIAHDLRAPLRSLQGYSDVLLADHSPGLDAQGQEFLRRISAAASRMDKLVQDVLSYSRVVRAETVPEPVALGALVQSIVEVYPQFAPERAQIEITGPLPTVNGNEAMLTQVFSNLLGNAVKFVPVGTKPRIRVWAETTAHAARVHVRDNGIGIAPDQQEKIFELFAQVDRGYGGTGIGLAIVKKTVERLRGRLGLTSTPGEGSTFWVELPLG